MLGRRYFGPRYYGPRYFGGSTEADVPSTSPGAPWAEGAWAFGAWALGTGWSGVEVVMVPPTPMGDYELYLNNVLRVPQYGWEVDALVNEQTSFRFDILSEAAEPVVVSDGRSYFSSYYFPKRFFASDYFGGEDPVFGTPTVYRPVVDEKVELWEGDELIFGGLITLPREGGLRPNEGGLTTDATAQIVKTSVNALDYKVLTQRRYVNETIPAGTLKAALTRIVTYLPGIILDAAQVDGPALNELTYDYVKVEDVLNALTTLTGYVREISYEGVLSMFLPGTRPAPYDITSTNDVVIGDIQVEWIRDRYANKVIAKTGSLVSIFNDDVEQATHPIWEVVITAPDTTDQIGLDALAAAYGANSIAVPRKIRYQTNKRGFIPGQTQQVNAPKRNLNGPFLITQVRSRRNDGHTFREIIAIEGATYQPDFTRTVYRQWSGGGVPIAGGSLGGGVAGAQRPVFPLEMNATAAVRANTPVWIDAPSLTHVQINTVERGTTAAIVKARMRVRTAGNTVQARLFNVSLNQPVPGVSTVINTTTWSPMVSWSVTLDPGAYVYKLQLLSGLVDSDVQITSAYLE